MKAFFFIGAEAGAGEKNTWSRSRSKKDRLRNTAYGVTSTGTGISYIPLVPVPVPISNTGRKCCWVHELFNGSNLNVDMCHLQSFLAFFPLIFVILYVFAQFPWLRYKIPVRYMLDHRKGCGSTFILCGSGSSSFSQCRSGSSCYVMLIRIRML